LRVCSHENRDLRASVRVGLRRLIARFSKRRAHIANCVSPMHDVSSSSVEKNHVIFLNTDCNNGTPRSIAMTQKKQRHQVRLICFGGGSRIPLSRRSRSRHPFRLRTRFSSCSAPIAPMISGFEASIDGIGTVSTSADASRSRMLVQASWGTLTLWTKCSILIALTLFFQVGIQRLDPLPFPSPIL